MIERVQLDVIANNFHPSAWEAETAGAQWRQGSFGLQSKGQATEGYRVTPFLK